MLVLLTMGSGALAFTRMAAWWVILPPTVMLLGYMGLLREAAKADAERREATRTRVPEVAAKPATPTAPVVPAAPVAPPAPVVADAEIIEIPAAKSVADEEFYDQYADAKLRAVGD
jgi:hypothetical protein